jgi:hypothetical protein
VVNVASTIEVLTTVITTTALQKLSLPAAAVETVGAASREELDHFNVLTRQFGGHPATLRVWIPDALFATPAARFTPNDRAFVKYNQPEPAAGPGHEMPGFTTASGAIRQFEAAGFGFGAKGQAPGAFYDFDAAAKKTPNPSFVNTRTPQ